MQRHKKQISIFILIILVGITTACPLGGSKNSKTIAKATDDFAEAQQSTAGLLVNARTSGLVSQEDINEIKPFLQEANDLNAKAIEYGRNLSKNPADPVAKENLISTINKISVVLVRANNAGLLRIKDKNTQIAFSLLVVTMQNAVTSVITILEN